MEYEGVNYGPKIVPNVVKIQKITLEINVFFNPFGKILVRSHY